MADDQKAVHRAGGVLESAYVRFRHFHISTIISTQALKLISPVIRKNLTAAFFFRVRNWSSELKLGILDEFSALVDPQILHELYKVATAEPFQFLYIDMLGRDIRSMFYRSFEARLIPGQREQTMEKITPIENGSGGKA